LMDQLDFGIPELDTAGTVFRDMLFLMVLGLVVLIFLVSFLIGPPAKHGQTAQVAEIVIEAIWPTGTKYDVDLWTMGPDGIPVGWGVHTTTGSLNLERDDRGKREDAAELNYETISVRTREPGEYTVNVHMFHNFGDPLPVPVFVKVTGKHDLGEIFSGQVMLERLRQELTVVRFKLDEHGMLIDGSLNNAYKEVLPVSSPEMRGLPSDQSYEDNRERIRKKIQRMEAEQEAERSRVR
ncbi:MAG: hypothetical protein IIA41_07530, partial [SAR324 cluster bacterium]|nr:hypothetical protein [SAR324 cluster bacterium]